MENSRFLQRKCFDLKAMNEQHSTSFLTIKVFLYSNKLFSRFHKSTILCAKKSLILSIGAVNIRLNKKKTTFSDASTPTKTIQSLNFTTFFHQKKWKILWLWWHRKKSCFCSLSDRQYFYFIPNLVFLLCHRGFRNIFW